MTEEKKDVIEIKKDSVKQFLLIVGASFVGCFLAVLLAGQLLKPKAPCCPCHRMMPPPCVKMFEKGHHHKHFAHKGHFRGDLERKRPPLIKDAQVQKKASEVAKSVTTAPQK